MPWPLPGNVNVFSAMPPCMRCGMRMSTISSCCWTPDEIPSRPVLQRLRADGLDGSHRLLMTRHYEAVDMLGPRSPCCPAADDPFPFTLGRLRPSCWNTLGYQWHSKSGVALPISAVIGDNPFNWNSPFTLRRAAPFDGALTNAGRHLCFVDPSCLPERKLGRVAHAEFATERSQWTVHLARCKRYAIHHRGWWYAERPAGKLPEDSVSVDTKLS